MWNCRLLSDWDPYGDYFFILPSESHLSLLHAGHFHVPRSLSIKVAFGCISKFASALFLLLSKSSSVLQRNVPNCPHSSKSNSKNSFKQIKVTTSNGGDLCGCHGTLRPGSVAVPVNVGKILGVAVKHLLSETLQCQPSPLLSIAASVMPSFDNLSSRILAIPMDSTEERRRVTVDLTPCDDEGEACVNPPLLSRSQMDYGDIVEPQTGVKFPVVLDKGSTDGSCSRKVLEVLVGMGSRSMKVIKVKTLKVYAFGLYVHPGSVCKKLGQKYKSIPAEELMGQEEFLQDLLREDIDMTVRLVVNCKGVKISTVRDVFERALRNRLLKMNPDADNDCLRVFGSYFSHDIPLSVGTTIDFRRTSDGQLITEVGGRQIGAVRNKDLCRAFFDMYIGDIPVSAQTKQEIGENVAHMVRRC